MRLSLHTDYGIRVLLYVSSKEERLTTTREISDFYKISYNHLVKVVHKLSQNGFLKVTRGRGGGYTLGQPAGKIRLGQVVRTLEPNFDIVECFNLETNQCRITSICKVKGHLNRALKNYLKELDEITLTSLTSEPFKNQIVNLDVG